MRVLGFRAAEDGWIGGMNGDDGWVGGGGRER